jgi:uncharacterized protein
MPPERIINIHAHLHHDQDVEARIRLWRECNVRKVCVLCMPPRPWGTSRERGYYLNEDLVPLLREHGDIIVGMGALDMSERPSHPDLVDRLRELGFQGLKVIASRHPYNHEIYFPLYERAEALGMPILFHTGWLGSPRDGTDGALGFDAENYRPYLLDRIARTFPRLRIVGAHLGKPHAEEALQMAIYANVYFDISGGSGKAPHVMWMLKALSGLPEADLSDPAENPALEHFKSFCFGTDNPEPPIWIAASERIMDALAIPDETRELFYWRNAADIYGWRESDLT